MYSGTRPPTEMPEVWMQRLCRGSVPGILSLYDPRAVLVPTYSKSDLPGAGIGVLRGRDQLAGYFERFMGKKGLCGTIDTMVAQRFGPVTVFSGLYTFRWLEGRRRKTATARYTYVTVAGPSGTQIVSHHSSAAP